MSINRRNLINWGFHDSFKLTCISVRVGKAHCPGNLGKTHWAGFLGTKIHFAMKRVFAT